MLFGTVVKPGKPTQSRADGGQVLHLSQACLNNPTSSATTYLQIIDGDSTINICALAKDKCEHASLDLFLYTDSEIQFAVKGPNEVHVSGYYEPDPEPTGFDMEDDSDDEVEEVDEDDEELMATAQSLPGKKLPALMPDKAMKKGANLAEAMNKASKVAKAPDSSDDEDSVDDEENDLSPQQQTGNDSSDDDEDNSDDSDINAEAIMQAVKNAKAAAAAGGAKAGVKRKGAAPQAVEQPTKKQAKKDAKEDESAASGGDDASKYQKAIAEYVKAHGRTPISQLGSQVKKPQNIKTKLGAFIKERPSLFKVENGFVSLVK